MKMKHAAWKVLFTVALASVMAFGGLQAHQQLPRSLPR